VRYVVALVALAPTSLGVGAAHAAPTSRLVYSRSSDADSCPDEQALRRAVAARVGYDPFFAWATRTIVASITRSNRAFVATVDLIDESGVSHGARTLHAEGECGELLDAVALAIAIAIDPQSLSRPSTPGAPPPAETEAPTVRPPVEVVAPAATAPDAAPTPPVVRPSDLHASATAFEASAGVAVSTGVAPGPAVGLALGAAARWRMLSLGLEGRIDAPSGKMAPGGGEVSSWLVLGAVAPCAHVAPFFGCALLQVGSAQTSGSGFPGTRSESLPWLATGGRLGVLFQVSEDVALRAHADVLANVDRQTLKLDGQDAWPAPLVTASLAIDMVLHFR
jgi:hypothetical protein